MRVRRSAALTLAVGLGLVASSVAAQPADDPNKSPLECTVVDDTTVVFANTTGYTIPQGMAIHYSIDLADGPNMVQFLYVPVELAPDAVHQITVRDPLASCRAWIRLSELAEFLSR